MRASGVGWRRRVDYDESRSRTKTSEPPASLMKVLITGAAGQLGRAMARAFGRANDVIACTRADLDITDVGAVRARVGEARPDVVINCAAFNDVDRAEDDAVAALEVNAFAVWALARAAADTAAVFVHYSTDFVFDGSASSPYTEDDASNPQSVYAVSKFLGERFACDATRYYVMRVESLFGGEPGASKGTFAGIVDAIEEGREVRVFTDRVVSPSHVEDVAKATLELVSRGMPFGLYHCVNSGMATWDEVAREVARRFDREACLVETTMAQVRLKAPRPLFCALSNAKLASAGIPMPTWQDALARYLAARGSRA